MATTLMTDDRNALSAPVRSTTSIIAILAAAFSFYFSGGGREFIGLGLAILAIAAGLIGGLKSLSPSVKGGILSIAAVFLGAVAIIFALVALIF